MKQNIENIKISNAMARIIKYEPFYGYLLQQVYFVSDPDVGTAAVGFRDGRIKLWYNPDFINELEVESIEVVLLHECGHLIRGHLIDKFNKAEVNNEILNIAMDATINPGLCRFKWNNHQYFQDLLVAPEDFLNGRIPQHGRFFGHSRDLEDYTAEDLYNYLIKNFPQLKQYNGQGNSNNQYVNKSDSQQCNVKGYSNNKSDSQQCNGQGNSNNKNDDKSDNQYGQGNSNNKNDEHQINDQNNKQQPGIIDNHNYMKTDEKDDVLNVIHDAVQRASDKSIGNIPKEIQDIVNKLLNEKSKVNWKKVLSMFIGSAITDKRRVSITRINKRYGIPFFGTRRVYISNIVIGMDVSGSIGDEEIKVFLREIDGICKMLNISIPIIQGDTIVEGVDKYNKKQHEFKRRAAGGTYLQPIIDLAKKKYRRSRLILFTDGFIPPITCPKKTLIVIPPSGTDEFEHDGGILIKIPKDDINN